MATFISFSGLDHLDPDRSRIALRISATAAAAIVATTEMIMAALAPLPLVESISARLDDLILSSVTRFENNGASRSGTWLVFSDSLLRPIERTM